MKMNEIQYRNGDIFSIPFGHKVIIAHIVNNVGAYGKGFAKAVADHYPEAQTNYWANFSFQQLGDITFRDVEADGSVIVADLYAQDGLPSKDNPQPLKYWALQTAIQRLSNTLLDIPDKYEIWMPKIGTGYARGKWEHITPLIKANLIDKGIPVVVFTPLKDTND